MNLSQIFASPNFCLSFEVFPPKTPEGDESLGRALEQLGQHQPSFVSCTVSAHHRHS